MKIVDFKTFLKIRDQRLVTKKVTDIVENPDIPGNPRQLKQHFRNWLVLEDEKIECQLKFTQHLNQDIIHG